MATTREFIHPGGHLAYSYRYPSNTISYFFLAQRHGYVRSQMTPGARNLDVACGLFKITKASVGLDAKAWKKPDVHGSALDMPFPDSHFDHVTMLEFIEHLNPEGQGKVLDEIHRVVKPGSQVILSMPNISSFMGTFYRVIWWCWERTVQHEYYHDHVGMIPRAEFLKLLGLHRFKVLKVKRVAVLDLVVVCQTF